MYTQLVQLRREHPDASLSDLARLVTVETRAADQKKLPALAQFAGDFERLAVTPALSDELIMDATRYEFAAKSYSGERMDLILLGPGPSAPIQPSPVLQWTEDLRRLLTRLFQ